MISKKRKLALNNLLDFPTPIYSPLIIIVRFIKYDERMLTCGLVCRKLHLVCYVSLNNENIALNQEQSRVLSEEKHIEFLNNKVIKVTSMTFPRSIQNGHLEIVKLLLKDERVDPSIISNYAIEFTSSKGHLEPVILLLTDKRVDPSAGNNWAIREASENGHLEIVKLLLTDKRVDPSVNYNYAIRAAAANGHLEIVKLLLQDKRVVHYDKDNFYNYYDKDNFYNYN